MDHYADDLAALTEQLDLRQAIHVGHSSGGGEVAHYISRHGSKRVAKAVLISSVPPLLVKSAANPEGVPIEVLDGIRAGMAANRAQLYIDFTLPFYGYNRPGAKISEGIREHWWEQGMMGSAQAHYVGIKAAARPRGRPEWWPDPTPTLRHMTCGAPAAASKAAGGRCSA